MLHETLIPLENTPNQERPTPPKRRQPRLILPFTPMPIPKRPRHREPHRPDQIPRPDPPPQRPRRGLPPPLLRLEHEEERGDDEARAADDLGRPVGAVDCARGQRGLDGGEGGEACDPEDRRGDVLGEAGEEANFAEVVVTELGAGGEPHPGLEEFGFGEFFGGEGFFLGRLSWGDFAVADEVLFVEVVVGAIRAAWTEAQEPVLLEGFFEGPAEALCAVFVDGFDHEEDTANLKDGRADEGGDAPAVCDFPWEGRRRAHGGKPDEEGVYDPDYRAPGEPLRDHVGHVPDGVVCEHAPEVVEDWSQGIRGWRGEELALCGGRDGYGVPAC
ncbi:hypothetical protein V499_01774 [Pseudogymnoascus sp. VKM F-103]|nr:hypothetical protein V499_01774 [Pseudogymnoascus sp. VKM F-103]